MYSFRDGTNGSTGFSDVVVGAEVVVVDATGVNFLFLSNDFNLFFMTLTTSGGLLFVVVKIYDVAGVVEDRTD